MIRWWCASRFRINSRLQGGKVAKWQSKVYLSEFKSVQPCNPATLQPCNPATLPLFPFPAIIPRMTRTNIVLTGFMGTGKSTVGRLIAKQLAYDFVDTDEWIEAENGRSVAEIFREAGEATFRQLERTAALTFAKTDGMVAADVESNAVRRSIAW